MSDPLIAQSQLMPWIYLGTWALVVAGIVLLAFRGRRRVERLRQRAAAEFIEALRARLGDDRVRVLPAPPITSCRDRKSRVE